MNDYINYEHLYVLLKLIKSVFQFQFIGYYKIYTFNY